MHFESRLGRLLLEDLLLLLLLLGVADAFVLLRRPFNHKYITKLKRPLHGARRTHGPHSHAHFIS